MEDQGCEQNVDKRTVQHQYICRCQDYILIDRGEGGTTEICGNSTTDNNTFLLDSNNFTVFFRTSEVGRFQGFKMNIACLGGDSACDMQGLQVYIANY